MSSILVEIERGLIMTKEFTPREIVAELDKYIVGQEKAKRVLLLLCGIDIVGINCQRNYVMRLCLKIF